MSLPLHCSSILYDVNFNPKCDITLSFTYNMDTQSEVPTSNNGFAVFFVDGSVPSINGGGPGSGIGVVSSTNVTETSAVSGIYLTIGFDVDGTFSTFNSIPAFTTGLTPGYPSIAVRKTSTFNFLSAVNITTTNLLSTDTVNTVRISTRKSFQEIVVHQLVGSVYNQVASIATNTIDTLPSSVKFGISYSGNTLFTIKDINVNGNTF